MKPKPSAFKSTFSTHIPTPAIQPAVPQVLPTLKEEPQYEKSLPSPESMDVGQVHNICALYKCDNSCTCTSVHVHVRL